MFRDPKNGVATYTLRSTAVCKQAEWTMQPLLGIGAIDTNDEIQNILIKIYFFGCMFRYRIKWSRNFFLIMMFKSLYEKFYARAKIKSECGNVWQSVHVGRLCRIWSVLERTHFLCGEIRSKEDWLLIQVQAIFHALASSHPLQGPNPPGSPIRLSFVERSLQIFSC